MNEKRHYLLVSESISTCASFLVQSRRDKGAAENFRTLIIRLSVRLARRDGVADSPALVTGVRGADPEHGAAPVVPGKRGDTSRPAAHRHARGRCARAMFHVVAFTRFHKHCRYGILETIERARKKRQPDVARSAQVDLQADPDASQVTHALVIR
jgi:hypothetical protein